MVNNYHHLLLPRLFIFVILFKIIVFQVECKYLLYDNKLINNRSMHLWTCSSLIWCVLNLLIYYIIDNDGDSL